MSDIDLLRRAAALMRERETDDPFISCVTDWLQVSAFRLERDDDPAASLITHRHALAVARAYLARAYLGEDA